MKTNFISSKDSDESRAMHTKSNNIEIIMGNETNEIIEELFKISFAKRSIRIRRKMRGSDFVFDSVHYCIIIFIK